MNKKLVALFVILLLVGLVLGGVIHNLISRYSDSSESNEKAKSPSLRRFGDVSAVKRDLESSPGKTKDSPVNEADRYFLSLMKMDAEEILAEIDRLSQKTNSARESNPLDQLALSFLYSYLGQKAPRQALAQMEQSPDLKRYQNQLLKAWSEKNPEAAMVYCLEANDNWDIFEKAGIIAKVSPEKALEWIKNLPDDSKSQARGGVFAAVLESQSDKMEEFIQKAKVHISDDPSMKSYIAERWILADKNAAMKWINSLPENEQIAVRASALKNLSLEEATQEVAMLQGKAKEAAMIQIAISLSHRSMDGSLKAAEWLMNNTGTDLKSWESVLNSVSSISTGAKDPNMQAYLTKLPAGEKKDLLVEKIVDRQRYSVDDLQESKSAEILSLALQIENPQKRESSVDNVLGVWISDSPADARQWIEKSNFSPEKKENLYKRCDRYAESKEK